MPEGPGVFSVGQIGLSAAIGAVGSFVIVWLYGRWAKAAAMPVSESIVFAILTGLSILFWRLAGNTPPLNEDPIPLVSPNDVLCPVVTYVVLGLYGGLRGIEAHPRWPHIRAALTILSLVVNIVTI
jgi:hypothetical protein